MLFHDGVVAESRPVPSPAGFVGLAEREMVGASRIARCEANIPVIGRETRHERFDPRRREGGGLAPPSAWKGDYDALHLRRHLPSAFAIIRRNSLVSAFRVGVIVGAADKSNQKNLFASRYLA